MFSTAARFSRRACLLSLVAMVCAPPALVAAGEAPCVTSASACEPTDFWLIDTKCAPACSNMERGLARIRYSRLEEGCFRASSAEAFRGVVDCSMPTIFFIHGNGTDRANAIGHARNFARRVAAGTGPYRMVVWLWPADRIRGARLRGNVRIKWSRSEYQGYYLAAVIDQLSPDARLALLGHSFGARTVLAALDGLTDRRVAGQVLPAAIYPSRRPIRAILVGAGVDNSTLLRGRSHAGAWASLDRLLVTVNPSDRVLRGLSRFSSTCSPQLGSTGVPSRRLGSESTKLEQFRVDRYIGGRHGWAEFMGSSAITTRFRDFLFGVNSI